MSNQPEVGKLIVFEGVDGVGKSTLARCLVKRLNDRGIASEYAAFPGGSPGTIGRVVYDIHHCPANVGIEEISPASLQALHIAAHLDAIERSILRTLDQGRWVILDRYWWSTRVYGSAAGVASGILDAMIHVERLLWKGTEPAMLFLVSRTDSAYRADYAMLHREYGELYEAELDRYPVRVIWNDWSVAESISDILAALVECFGDLNVGESAP